MESNIYICVTCHKEVRLPSTYEIKCNKCTIRDGLRRMLNLFYKKRKNRTQLVPGIVPRPIAIKNTPNNSPRQEVFVFPPCEVVTINERQYDTDEMSEASSDELSEVSSDELSEVSSDEQKNYVDSNEIDDRVMITYPNYESKEYSFTTITQPHLGDIPTPDSLSIDSIENLEVIEPKVESLQFSNENNKSKHVPTKQQTHSKLPNDTTPIIPDSSNKIFRTIKMVQNNEERKRIVKKLDNIRQVIIDQKQFCHKHWTMNKKNITNILDSLNSIKDECLKIIEELDEKVIEFKVMSDSQNQKFNSELNDLDQQVVDLHVKNTEYLTSSNIKQQLLKTDVQKLEKETFQTQKNIKEKLKSINSNQSTIDTFKDSLENLSKKFFKRDYYIKLAENDFGTVDLEQLMSSTDEFLGVGYDNGFLLIIYRTKEKYLKYHILNKHFRHISTVQSEIKYLGEVKIQFRNKHFIVSLKDVYRVEILNMRLRRLYTTLNRFKLSLIGCDDIFVYLQSKYGSVFRYDWKLKYTDYFGQTNDQNRIFYFPSKIDHFEQKNGKYYYIGNNRFYIADAYTGKYLESFQINADQFQLTSSNKINLWTHSNEFLTLTVNNNLFVNTQSLSKLNKNLKFFLIDNIRPCFYDKENNSFLIYNL